ncbi:NCA2-domain-containing protein [Artomyces pyxidatus]|uniref:NCA2-domain-containing protein n=1 Tax=Artomyces pyxidatus TaxID=48021 RepID=A0ACB8SK74_9AGAM|nr:NCA2-domain-containing protein [Artomyces pyxidatus]
MSASVAHLTNDLILSSVPSETHLTSYSTSASSNRSKESLRSLFVSLSPPLTPNRISDAIQALQSYDSGHAQGAGVRALDEEDANLRDAIIGRLMAGLYASALDTFLSEASDAETEAEWWADVERSRLSVGYHLVQTLPSRLVNLAQNVLRVLNSQNRSFTPSILTISSLRNILDEKNTGRPNALSASLFPHLHTHPHLLPLSQLTVNLRPFSLSSRPSENHVFSAVSRIQATISDVFHHLLAIITFPIELTRQECNLKRRELERVRDARAEALGELTSQRDALADALHHQSEVSVDERGSFLQTLNQIIAGQTDEDLTQIGPEPSILEALTMTSAHVLPLHISQHKDHLRSQSLTRPSRLTLLWPRLVLLPPLTLLLVREAIASQDSLIAMAQDALATVKGFWRGWLVEPIADIVKTVRTGGDQGMIVQKESIDADLQSLERMALSLAKDKLGYGEAQLQELTLKLRTGDLTPILQIYEQDIRSPFKSAVGGTLLRSVFVQVQKAKVDIDQALAGIDKLLKSQELTFAFVGVAPALAIVYVSAGSLRALWSGGRGKGRYGGRKRQTAAWLAMRRIERLLVSQPHSAASATRAGISPLTSGLLLLSVSSLRKYAETSLPARSRLREGFLEDVGDLEDPGLGRDEKIRVVQRMWRSWGSALGWDKGGGSIDRAH